MYQLIILPFYFTGWHWRINTKAGRADLGFYALVPLLRSEAETVDHQTRLVSAGVATPRCMGMHGTLTKQESLRQGARRRMGCLRRRRRHNDTDSQKMQQHRRTWTRYNLRHNTRRRRLFKTTELLETV